MYHLRLSHVLAPWVVSQIGSFKSMDVISCWSFCCVSLCDTKKATSVQDFLVLTYTVKKRPICCLFLKLKFCKCGLENQNIICMCTLTSVCLTKKWKKASGEKRRHSSPLLSAGAVRVPWESRHSVVFNVCSVRGTMLFQQQPTTHGLLF